MIEPAVVVPPGSTIGIFGGGQLGRMTSMAAAKLGYRCHIFSPDRNSPASQVAADATTAAYDDRSALDAFAGAVDVVTAEFENVPAASLEHLSASVPVRPSASILTVAQNRIREKDYLKSISVGTAEYCEVRDLASLEAAIDRLGHDCILKCASLGYDGKGQVTVNAQTDPAQALETMGSTRGILEAKIDFSCEVSVIVARSISGAAANFIPVENRHINHILDTTIAPAHLSKEVAAKAAEIARHIAEQLQIIGLLAVEMFVTRDGNVLVNEIAPRPHNSGHWTIDACRTSQFEQLVRAITGLPLGSTKRHADAIMRNLIGSDVENWQTLSGDPEAHLHLYGKSEIMPGRKMGHVTRLFPIGAVPNA